MKKIFDKFKNTNFKSLARAFSVIWMFVFIVIMTITNIGIDDKFNWLMWLGSAMILFGITVYGLFVAEGMAKDHGKKRIVRNDDGEIIGGEYQKALKDYDVVRKSVNPIISYFPTFYSWFVPLRIDEKKTEFLIMHGVNSTKASNIVKYATLEDFANMKAGPVKFENDIIVRKLQETEIEPVEIVLKNQVPYELSSIPYYLQATAESNNYDIMEMGAYYKKARKENRRLSYASRIVVGLVFSIGMSLFTVGDFVSGNNAQAWMNLVTRVGNLFTSMLSGWISGASDVHLECLAIRNKIDVLEMFKSSHEQNRYEHLTEEELAKKEWEDNEKRKQEAVKDVVEPELIMENKPFEIEEKDNIILSKGE